MKYTVKTLIKKLQTFDENLQVTIFNSEYVYNDPDITIEVIEKKSEVQHCQNMMDVLDERFLSFR